MKTMTVLSAIALSSALALACLACNAGKAPQPKKADLAEAVASAANEKADRQQQDATMALAKADYRDRVTAGLAEVDRRIDDLRAGRATAKPYMTADYDSSIASLQARRDALSSDLRLIDTATADGWVTIKSQADRDLDEAKSSLPVLGKT